MIGLRGIPHTYGGGEEFVLHLAPRLVQRGHHVTVYCRRGSSPDRSPEWRGVQRVFYPTIEHKSLGQFLHSAFGTLDSAVRRPDIVYMHTLPSGPHSLLPWLLRQRIVFNVDGMDWARDKWGPVGKAYFRAAASIVVKVATAVITDAEEMQRIYRERFGRETYRIAYGAEIHRSDHPELIRPLGVEPNGYYLIASRLVPENNADIIIEAFVRSRSTRTLIVAGGANFSSPWVNRVRAVADPRIRFVGHVSDPMVVRELHCNCYGYIHGHSLGGTNPALLKALGCGNLVLALDTPFNREVLTLASGSPAGLFFPRDPAALAQLIDEIDADAPRAKALREAAPRRIREAYTWEHITDQYEMLFREVADQQIGSRLP